MKLPFKERKTANYIYINPKTNQVHMLMPIMSGGEIGIDNTCKSALSLQEFFGLLGANRQSTGILTLEAYQSALMFDLKYMKESTVKDAKRARLLQIEMYQKALNQIKDKPEIKDRLRLDNPLYPAPVESLMQRKDANLHTIIIRPEAEDYHLRTTAIKPTFNANHGRMVNGNPVEHSSLLYETLKTAYAGFHFEPQSKEGFIQQVISSLKDKPVDFEATRTTLSKVIKDYLGLTLSFDKTKESKYVEAVLINQTYLDNELGIREGYPATHKDYVQGLLDYCVPNLFDTIQYPPFYSVNSEADLLIVTQFFLATLNIACKESGLTVANFGQVLEGDTDLTLLIANAIKGALKNKIAVEDAVIQVINDNQARFGLNSLIPEELSTEVKARFQSHYALIKESPHFDEFMLLGKKPGLFVAHNNIIATQFANLMQTAFFKDLLDEPTQAFLKAALQDFETVDKPDNILPHQNAHIHETVNEIDLDLSQMDKDALQTLYEEINTYPDKDIKAGLLSQLIKERSDFKPKIDAKQFLQHVAYGEQDEAEALLQKDPTLAQALLRTDNIPFTDYSGRTFNCTAYEYAYWAKDTHMQRMLEKYIRQDEETRQDIFARVEAIEKPLSDSGFFEPAKPRGLHYTTQDKQGNITDHWEAHVSLQPLIDALTHYVTEYDNRPNKTNDDWAVLDEIWVKEVGGAQRNLPAHMAHEYCHPDRSFYDVNQNPALLDAAKPDNLKRQLKFYNFEIGNFDSWFSKGSYLVDSGLGFLFGILRASAARGLAAAVGGWRSGHAALDLVAVKTIDKVRTDDLKQSHKNLSSPSIQVSHLRGI